jgi:hypothetical protein
MANRVTGSEVLEIIATSLSSSDVAPMITAANILVTAKCAVLDYTSAELKEIERWLSAHFVSVRDPSRSAVVSKTIDTVSEEYAFSRSDAKSSIETTPYGQQALLLDYRGGLATLGKGKTASIAVYGADNDEFDEDTT